MRPPELNAMLRQLNAEIHGPVTPPLAPSPASRPALPRKLPFNDDRTVRNSPRPTQLLLEHIRS